MELGRMTPHVTFGVFAALGLLVMCAIGGVFEGASVAVGGTSGSVKVDAPYTLGVLTTAISLFGVIAHAGIAGGAASRDFAVGMHPLVFTAPMSKITLFGARLFTTVGVNLYVISGTTAGLLLGLLFVDGDRRGALSLLGVVAPYLSMVGPNVLLTCALFFSLALLSRSMFANYVGGVGLLVAYLGAGAIADDLDNRTVAAMLDPFGMQAMGDMTEYWTAFQQNTEPLLPAGLLLANRVVWVVFALVFAAGVLVVAPTDQTGWAPLARFRRGPAGANAPASAPPRARPERVEVHARDDFAAHFAQYRALTARAVAGILRNRYFFAFVFAALTFLGLNASVIGSLYGTTTWPVTYEVLDVFGGSFALFNLILITFYAGDLVWHDRDVRIASVVDATPVPGWVSFASRLTALWVAMATLQLVIVVAGVITQAAKGYTNFELGVYLQGIYLYGFAGWALLCVLALTVHTVVNAKYVGHFVMILYYAASAFRGQFGFEHNLYFFGADPGTVYSDMNAWGWFSGPYFLYQAYWACWALVLAVASQLLWVRGTDTGWRGRLVEARRRVGPGSAVAAAVGLVGALSLGGVIFYETNVLHGYRTSEESLDLQVGAEQRWRAAWYQKNQPRLVDLDVAVDLFPDTGSVTTRGVMQLVNRGDAPISEVFVSFDGEAVVTTFEFEGGATQTEFERDTGVRIFQLTTPMQPGERRSLTFDLGYPRRGFPNSGAETSVVDNGTFVNSMQLFPSFGYSPSFELQNEHKRRDRGLEVRDRMLPPDDPYGLANTYIAHDADWIGFRATVSTIAGQTALAPGYLVKQWEEGGRSYFRYEMDRPILSFTSFLSARYEVTRGAYGEIPIEVYHDPKHRYNVDRMIAATARALAVYERAFGPYQHRQVRILEFPRYASFAQSFPNTIPFSEAIGFIARVDDEEDVDYPFYVTAHEVAHQWWAHQVIGADVQGSTMLSETLSQYSALLVMEEEYGPYQIRKFLEYELKSYLQGRASESKEERPLVLVENQPYIHYNKGAVNMWLLADVIGKDKVNAVLSGFVTTWGSKGPPYPTAGDLVMLLRAATPAADQYLIEDLFETITLYENKATEATVRDRGDGTFEVTVAVDLHKYRAGEDGEDTEAPMNDWVDIGLFAEDEEDDEPLYLQRHRLVSGAGEVTVVVPSRPAKAGVDPYHKLIDRHLDDNFVDVAEAGDAGA
jgi:hypothetical protein